MPRMPILIRVYYFRQPVDVEDSAACDDTNLLDRIILPDTFQCTQIRKSGVRSCNIAILHFKPYPWREPPCRRPR